MLYYTATDGCMLLGLKMRRKVGCRRYLTALVKTGMQAVDQAGRAPSLEPAQPGLGFHEDVTGFACHAWEA